MAKLGIYYELDEEGKDTGRVQVADMDEEIVYDTFDTEKEAEAALLKMQALSDRDDRIKTEYLLWEDEIITKYSISPKPSLTQEELRGFLVNCVLC